MGADFRGGTFFKPILLLREERRLGVFKNRGTSGIFGADKDEITGGNCITKNFLKSTPN
jgi:hypothetical protein